MTTIPLIPSSVIVALSSSSYDFNYCSSSSKLSSRLLESKKLSGSYLPSLVGVDLRLIRPPMPALIDWDLLRREVGDLPLRAALDGDDLRFLGLFLMGESSIV